MPPLDQPEYDRKTLLDLPGEIRNDIYLLVMGKSSSGIESLESILPLASTCRQVRSEVISLNLERTFIVGTRLSRFSGLVTDYMANGSFIIDHLGKIGGTLSVEVNTHLCRISFLPIADMLRRWPALRIDVKNRFWPLELGHLGILLNAAGRNPAWKQENLDRLGLAKLEINPKTLSASACAGVPRIHRAWDLHMFLKGEAAAACRADPKEFEPTSQKIVKELIFDHSRRTKGHRCWGLKLHLLDQGASGRTQDHVEFSRNVTEF